MNPLLQVSQHGQQIWLDNLSRTLLREGHLARFIAEDGIAGVGDQVIEAGRDAPADLVCADDVERGEFAAPGKR